MNNPPYSDDDPGALRSPIRPNRPQDLAQPSHAAPLDDEESDEKLPTDPHQALDVLRAKSEHISNEYAQGKINKAQFKAMYARYSEQRAIIERLIERDPQNSAWEQVARPGVTTFLRAQYEARPLYYLVFLHNKPRPLLWGGSKHPNGATIINVLKALWSMQNRPKTGVATRRIGEVDWLLVAVGEFSLTIVLYSLEPSALQATNVLDMHLDFERANRVLLSRGVVSAEKMVFPQRGLLKQSYD